MLAALRGVLAGHPPAECIEFMLKHRSENGPDVEAAEKFLLPIPKPPEFPPPSPVVESIYQQHLERIDELIRKQVHVEITWRSKLKRWSSETTRTGNTPLAGSRRTRRGHRRFCREGGHRSL